MMETPSNLEDLRDRFAAHALGGIMAAECDGDGGGSFTVTSGAIIFNTTPRRFAEAAYLLADAMLAERAREKAGPPAEAT